MSLQIIKMIIGNISDNDIYGFIYKSRKEKVE